MTTATKSRKRSGSKSSGKPSSNGSPKVKGSKDDPAQMFIDGTEPETIPALDAVVARYTNLRKSMETAKESAADELGKIKGLMEVNGIEFYKTPFGDVSVQHGVTIVKVKLPKSR